MGWISGAKDTIKYFELTINREIRELMSKEDVGVEDYAGALDAIIATLYIVKLHASMEEDDYIESLEGEMNCGECDYIEGCYEFNTSSEGFMESIPQFMNKLFKEEF